MVKLKSYRLKLKKPKKIKLKPIKDITTAGITTLIGTAFVSQTADIISRL